MTNLNGKTVVIVGLGKSGVAAAELCAQARRRRGGQRRRARPTSCRPMRARSPTGACALAAGRHAGRSLRARAPGGRLARRSSACPCSTERATRRARGDRRARARVALRERAHRRHRRHQRQEHDHVARRRDAGRGGQAGLRRRATSASRFRAWRRGVRRARPRGVELPDGARADVPPAGRRAPQRHRRSPRSLPELRGLRGGKGNMFVNQGEEDVAVVPKGDARVAQAQRGRSAPRHLRAGRGHRH